MNQPSASQDLPQLLWSGGDRASFPQMLAAGALVWALYSVVQLAAHGVVMDEAVMPAQIIAGAVFYPPGHPHQIFYSQAFSLPNYLCAALWKWIPNAVVISALRDLLFVFVSVFMPFACALLLTRRPVWGHFAAVLTLTEAGIGIQGFYPTWVFPDFYSHGHIGLEAAVLTAILLLAGFWRLGGVLLGLMPAIHVTMSLVLWPWSVLWFLLARGLPQGRDRIKLAVSFCSGLGICVALALFIFSRAHPAPLPPYDVHADGQAIIRGFTTFSDYHRRAFPFRHMGYLANLMAFCALGAFLWHDASPQDGASAPGMSRRSVTGLLLFGAVAWTWVYATRIVHLVLGHFPQLLEQVMPNRFSDFSSVLLVPLTAAALAAALEPMSETLRARALALVTLCLCAAGVLQGLEGISFAWLYPGRVGRFLIFFVWGLVFAIDLVAHWAHSRRRNLSLAVAAGLTVGLAVSSSKSFATFAFLAGFFLAAAFLVLVARASGQSPAQSVSGKYLFQPALLTMFMIITASSLLSYRRELDRWTRLSPADRELKGWLDNNAAPGDQVLTPLSPRAELQTKTGHPVLMELETLYVMTYMPRLASVVGTMARDLYGLDYANPEKLYRLASGGRVNLADAWIPIWTNRTLAEWQALGRRYRFRLVLSSAAVPLQLPEAFRSGTWVLYSIPEGSSAEYTKSSAADL